MKKLLSIALCLVLAVTAKASNIGSTPYINAGVSTTLQVVIAKVSVLTGYNFCNTNTSPVFVQFFDAASTSGITLGTTKPSFSLAVPAGGGVTDNVAAGMPGFQNGIVIAVTTTQQGNTAPAISVPVTLFSN